MKNRYLFLVLLLSAMTLVSCKKDTTPDVVIPPTVTPVNQNAGLGQAAGYPVGISYSLPDGISVVGYIRGGISGGKAPYEKTYKGPFKQETKANYVTLGTGTYVHLYMTLYNSLLTNISFSMPGGLIFIDSNDVFQHVPVYQKGYILQDVDVTVNALDTAYIELNAYCLNHTLSPSSYDAVYFFGPVTTNTQLNQVTNIMASKQYPFGEEYNIQTIIWNITDNGLTLTATEIAYLNSLP